MDRLRPLVTKWYANHAEAIQLLSSGEIDICCTIGPRGITAKREGAPIEVEYNQGKLAPDNWAIVKGARNIDAVYQFLSFAIDGKVQAELAKRVPYGPSSQDAFNFLTEAEAKELNTSPANIPRQFWNDTAWWGEIGPDRQDEPGSTNGALRQVDGATQLSAAIGAATLCPSHRGLGGRGRRRWRSRPFCLGWSSTLFQWPRSRRGPFATAAVSRYRT